MKKEHKILFSILAALSLAVMFIFIMSFANAQEITAPALPGGLTPEQIGELGQKTPEELANESANYLRAEWAKIMQEKAPFLWTAHIYLLGHQTPFKVAFNREYSFTWAFLFVLLIWAYLASFFQGIFDNLGIIKANVGWIVGILLAVSIAQTNGINWLVERVSYLVSAQAAWWMRLVLWAVVIGVFALSIYLRTKFKKIFEAMEKARKEEKIEQEVEELKAESKGREEGRKISEPIRKAKKEHFESGGGI